jgi:hypothetical protein
MADSVMVVEGLGPQFFDFQAGENKVLTSAFKQP